MNIVIPKKWMAAVICGTTFVSTLLLVSISAPPEVRTYGACIGAGHIGFPGWNNHRHHSRVDGIGRVRWNLRR